MLPLPNKKSALLEAANAIVIEQGSQDLTLDAVAKRAGVSKGGLLYHFPTKDALIEGLIDYLLHQVDELIEQKMQEEAEGGTMPVAGRWLRAFAKVSTSPRAQEAVVARSLTAITLSDVKYTPIIEQLYERWAQRARKDGISHQVADLVCIASDGCWLYGLYHPHKSKARLLSLRQTLLSLIDNDLKQNPSGALAPG